MRTATLGLLALCFGAAVAAGGATAAETDDGRVEIPLDVYRDLVEAGRQPTLAPAGYALGNADLSVSIQETEGRATAEVAVGLTIEVLEDRWVLVPILPAGTSVQSVAIDGKAVQLINAPGGLAWGVQKRGTYAMQLRYRVDATRSKDGFVLPVPTPEAAATKLAGSVPGAGLDVAVIPASGVEVTARGDRTHFAATVPATRGLQLSWRAPSLQSHTVSRAHYAGELVGDAIRWTAELSVELVGEEAVTLELLPKHVTLSDIQVDGREAPIQVSGQSFATRVRGRGFHRLRIAFEGRSSGPTVRRRSR